MLSEIEGKATVGTLARGTAKQVEPALAVVSTNWVAGIEVKPVFESEIATVGVWQLDKTLYAESNVWELENFHQPV